MHASIVTPSSTFRRSRKSFRLLYSALLIAVVSGCAILRGGDSSPHGAVKLDSMRKGPPANLQTVPVTVRYDEFRKAESNPDVNRMRVVRIVTSPSAAGAGDELNPEYRLFDIQKGGVAQVLGLENADVLVAANGYVVYHPDQFMRYLAGLPVEGGTFIELRRNGKPMLLKYTFSGEDPWEKSGLPAAQAKAAEPSPAAANAAQPTAAPAGKPTLLPVLNNSEEDEAEMKGASAPTPVPALKKPPAITPAVDKAPRKNVKPTPTPTPTPKKATKKKKKK